MKAVNVSEDAPKKPFIVIESVYNAGNKVNGACFSKSYKHIF